MIWLTALAALFAMVAALYAAIMVFSHWPRPPTAAELKYETNDGLGAVHDLPTRMSAKHAPEDEKLLLSVIIPCFNETARLGKMLEEAAAHLLATHPKDYEFVIVDDGSSDGTAEYALEKATELRLAPGVLKVVRLEENRGKGGAVTHGLLHGLGKFLLFADADGATQFSDAELLINYLQTVPVDQPAVSIGSRAHMVNTDAVVKRLFVRNFLMYGLHMLVFVFGIRDVQDTQCGFKMFNREAVRNIFPHMHTERWIFDVEVLMLSEIQKMAMKEIPVSWQEVGGSKVDLARDLIQMAIDLVVTRIAYLIGVYRVNERQR